MNDTTERAVALMNDTTERAVALMQSTTYYSQKMNTNAICASSSQAASPAVS